MNINSFLGDDKCFNRCDKRHKSMKNYGLLVVQWKKNQDRERERARL